MNKTLEGMAQAICFERSGRRRDCALGCTPDTGCLGSVAETRVEISYAIAALLWLASNVSDEMVWAYLSCKPTNPRNLHNAICESISAALRAAAEGSE